MSTTLPLYWNLSSPSIEERLEASTTLIEALQKFQAQHDDSASEERMEAEGDDSTDFQFERLNAPDVRYAVKRLVRGLASSRESSRIGFAVAFTELLSRLSTVSCKHVIALILEMSQTNGSMKGQEERDVLFGRLFGLTAIIESRLLFRTTPPDIGSSTFKGLPQLDDFQTVLKSLFELGEKKSWLRESSWWAAIRALEALYASSVAWRSLATLWISATVFQDNKEWSPEKVAFALRLQRLDPGLDWRGILAPTFKQSNLVSSSNLPTLGRILKDLPVNDEDSPHSAHGSWKPQLHFVWNYILDAYLDPHGAEQASLSPMSEFQDFFRIVVDESLLAASSSPERKLWGFQVFSSALSRLPSAQLPMIFSSNLMRTWINHLSNHDRFLHKPAVALVDKIREAVQANPSIGFTLVAQLTGKNGNQQFDRITKTKTVESLISSMDAQGVQEYVNFLLQQAYDPVQEESQASQADSKRAWVLDQLHSLVRNGTIPKHPDWISKTIEFLVLTGFFSIRKKSAKSPLTCLRSAPNPPFSDTLREKSRDKLYAVLAASLSQDSVPKGGKRSLPASGGDVEGWLGRAVDTAEQFANDGKHVRPLREPAEDEALVRGHALQMVQKAGESKTRASAGAQVLLQFLVLRTHDPDFEDYDTISDCTNAVARILGTAKTSPEIGEEETEAINVIVDTLIGFLEASAASTREIAVHVFRCLTQEVLPSTIDLILAQLESKRAGDGDADVFMDSHSQSDVPDDDGAAASSPEDESESESDSSVTDDDGEVNPELRARLAQVLQENGAGADLNDDEDGSSSEEAEETIDDDQMLLLDDQLADVLRSQVSDKKGQKDAQREATHFKIRVTDLLDAYMKLEPTSPRIIQMIVPLVDLAAFSSPDEKQLASKASGLLNSRVGGAKEYPKLVDADKESAAEILEELHDRARRAGPLQVITQCCLYVCKLLAHDQAVVDPSVINTYRNSLDSYLTRKTTRLNTKFFIAFMNRYPRYGWALRDRILELTALKEVINPYRQSQAFLLVDGLLGQIPALKSASSNFEVTTDELVSFFTSLRQACYEAIADACDRAAVAGRHVKDILKTLQQAIRLSKRQLGSVGDIRDIWVPETFIKLQERIRDSDQSKPTAALDNVCGQISSLLSETNGTSQTSTSRAKTEATESPERQRAIQTADRSGRPNGKSERKDKPLKRARQEDRESGPKKKKKASDSAV